MRKVPVYKLTTLFVGLFISIYSSDIFDDLLADKPRYHQFFQPMRITNNDQREIEIIRTYHSFDNIVTEIRFFKEPCESLVCELHRLLKHMDEVAINELLECLQKPKQVQESDSSDSESDSDEVAKGSDSESEKCDEQEKSIGKFVGETFVSWLRWAFGK